MDVERVTVYCASSRKTDPDYHRAARRLGEVLAGESITIVYGGGAVGSMGQVADGAISRGGRVVGVIPRFMYDLEWAHPSLSDLHVVDDLHERKRLMIDQADAVVALPGGCGTLEELFEAITWKRLGLYMNPIVMVNVRGFFDRCASLLDHCVNERFMGEKHRSMWTLVDAPEDVPEAIRSAPAWSGEARDFAVP